MEVGRAHFEENFVKKQKVLEARPIRPPQGRSKVGTGRTETHHRKKKHDFYKKNVFFSQNTSMVASWAPAAQGPSHDATFYASWAHPFYFCKLHTF